MSRPRHPIHDTFHIKIRISLIGLLVLIVGILSIVAAIRSADAEYQRDLKIWEMRLDTVADTRAGEVEQWLGKQMAELEAVADNLSLRLYLTEYLSEVEPVQGPGPVDTVPQLTFLRNYLALAASRAGFVGMLPAPDVPANIPTQNEAGILLLSMERQPVVASGPVVPADGGMQSFIQNAERGRTAIRDMYLGPRDIPMMAWLVPVFAVQGDPVPESQVGWVLGVKPVSSELFPILNFPKLAEKSAETYLVREREGVIEYLSPTRDGGLPLKRRLDKNDILAAVFASQQPDHFSIRKNYTMTDVLVTGRRIAGSDWVLVHTIAKNEALQDSEARRSWRIASWIIGIAAVLLLVFSIWAHGTSVRFQQLAEKFKSQEALLRLVTDNEPDAMTIVDQDGVYRFANRKAATMLETTSDEMAGRRVRHFLGQEKADHLHDVAQEVLAAQEARTDIERREEQGKQKVFLSNYIPLQHIPHILTDTISAGLLVVEQDITEAITERERRERLLRNLVDKLVLMVDSRDSHAAYHSERVGCLAEALAFELNLDNVLVETAQVAGKLMNIGKVLVPPKLFAKKGKLTDAEHSQIVESIQAGADFLDGLEFDGPVVETLRQSQERWNGSGPLRKKGDEILITAQIISICNAYVAMISPRAYRPGIEREQVLKQLMELSDKHYQRRIVAAFVSYIENSGEDRTA
ncbi:MAG: PAS domain-containing protein [Hyphomicrobiales bacterium]|nr:PAS domain-containing protein [Rickettsiales bacterium]MCP5361181.1 PAS domain-containing protein [Hyphomicrobiales bacterium]